MNTKLKIYIGGAYEEKELVNKLILKLSESPIGCEITHNWTTKEKKDLSYEDPRSGLPEEDNQRHALLDFNGVRDADVVVIYISSQIYARRGTSTEFGIALGLGKKIIIFYEGDESVYINIFINLPNNNISKVKVFAQLEQCLNLFSKEKSEAFVKANILNMPRKIAFEYPMLDAARPSRVPESTPFRVDFQKEHLKSNL